MCQAKCVTLTSTALWHNVHYLNLVLRYRIVSLLQASIMTKLGQYEKKPSFQGDMRTGEEIDSTEISE